MAEVKKTKRHSFKFFRAGGVDQVVLESGADIANLHSLDLKLWIAVAMPTKGTELDPRTARYLDLDDDGRIRAQDVLATIDWMKARMTDLDPLLAQKGEVAFDRIAKPELARTARNIATELEAEATVLTLAHVLEAEKRFTQGRFNGDGVVTPATATEPLASSVIAAIVSALGGVADRSGTDGVDAAKLEAFFTDARALVAWQDEGDATSAPRPLGDATAAAAALVRKLTPKVEDYFTRCRLVAFDERAAAASSGLEAELAALAGKDVARATPELTRLPLAKILANQPLPLEGAANPAYAADLLALRDTVATPILGGAPKALTESDWAKLVAALAPYEAWVARKPATKLDSVDLAVLKSALEADVQGTIAALIAEDAERKDELDRILEAEKLVYLHRDLVQVLRNFVSFSDFYGRRGAIFQAGTLYLDGRACGLSVEVPDVTKHAAIAGLAASYLAYCEIRRKGEPNRFIVAAFMAGDSDNLMVGRNGLFIDRKGRDWDATITKIVDNPISIRQAFWSPYKKFARLLEEQVAKRATEADTASQAKLKTAAETTAQAGSAPAAATPTPAPARKIDVGTVAAIGVAVGGIGAMVTGLVSAFFGLGMFMPLGVLAIILLISGPSMLLAYLKLRRRNIGPILDASGWAVNGLAIINVPFGGALTGVAALPPGAKRLLEDPYAPKKAPIKTYAVLVLLVLLGIMWTMGTLDTYLPASVRAANVLYGGESAAAPAEPAAETAPAAPAPAAP
jgi:hypothetical protein